MDEPIDAFAGWVLLGFGALLGYATWKHVPGGAIGLIKQAVTTGKISTNAAPPMPTTFYNPDVPHPGDTVRIRGLPGAPMGAP